MGDEAGPADREVTSLRFQQMCRLKIFDQPPNSLTPPERLHLIAVSNKYGYTFIGSDTGVKVFKTSEVGRLNEATKDLSGARVSNDYECIKISLGTRPQHISLNNQELILSVCYCHGDQTILNFYHVRTVLKDKSPTPFSTSILSQGSSHQLMDLTWNPTFAALLVTCLSDGSCALWDCSGDSLKMLAELPSDVAATAVCWSPKGKQLVVGTEQGELKQFTHATELKKHIRAPDFAQEPVKVVDILWLSTYMFIVAYIDAEESLQPNVVVVHAAKEKPVTYINFEDMCYGSGEDRSPGYYMHYMEKWAFTIACSNNSIEAAVLGRKTKNQDLWEIWTLDDAARVEMPLCDQEETLPLGMAMDYTSRLSIKIKNGILCPAPILMVLSSEGLLCPFYVINLEDREGITKQIQELPVEGSTSQVQEPVAAKSQPSIPQPTGLLAQAAVKQPSATTQASTHPQPAFGSGTFSFGGVASASGISAGFQFKPPAATSTGVSMSAPSAPTTAASGDSQSIFGSSGFNFNAPRGGLSSITTQGSASKGGFSFSQAAQSLGTSSPSFSFKGNVTDTNALSVPAAGASGLFDSKPASGSVNGSAPPTFTSAAPSNAFVSLSKPASSAAATLPPSIPQTIPTEDAEHASSSQPATFRGPPHAVASAVVVTRAPGLLGAVPKGPPNVLAPSASVIPQGPPNATAPQAAGVPNISKPAPQQPVGAQVQPAPLAPRSRSIPAGSHNAMPPSSPHGLPSCSDAKAATEPPAVQVTPKAAVSKDEALLHTASTPVRVGHTPGISAVSTPIANTKPVAAALLSNIKEEMEHFSKELTELQTRATVGSHSVGSTSDLEDICTGVNELTSFKVEVLECTKSMNDDVHSLKSKLLNSFSLVEESRLRKQRSKDPHYVQLLKSRSLDPQTARQMQVIRSLHHYLEMGLRDANSCLDSEWEKISHYKGSRHSRKMVTPTMDAIYQTMSNNMNTMATQQNKLMDLRKQMTTTHRYNIPSTSSALPSPKIGTVSDPSSLASRLDEARAKFPPKGRSTPLPAKKQAILRDVLSQRQSTPIRSAPRAAVVRSSSVTSATDLENASLPQKRLWFPSDESSPHPSLVDGAEHIQPHHVPMVDLTHVEAAVTAPAVKTSQPQEANPVPIAPQGGIVTTTAQASQDKILSNAPPTQTTTSGNLPPAQSQDLPPKTSGFTHTGSGTVAWGMTEQTNKVTSPSQLAGVAALNRAQAIKAGNQPVDKTSPPVVNIKNLDSMKDTMPPPVTFAPVASTVDAGTAKVVTQVIAEMARASGVQPPQPGTPASPSGDSLHPSLNERKVHHPAPAAIVTTAALPTNPVRSALASLSPMSSQPAGLVSAPGHEKAVIPKENKPPPFSFATKPPGLPPSAAMASTGVFSFGMPFAPPAVSTSGGLSFSSAPHVSTVATLSSSASVNPGDVVTRPSKDESSGVKPQIFDFSGSLTKPIAATAAPGDYFFGGGAGPSSVADNTVTTKAKEAPISLAGPVSSSIPVSAAGVTAAAAPSEKPATGQMSQDESGIGMPTGAPKPSSATNKSETEPKPSVLPFDEAGTGVKHVLEPSHEKQSSRQEVGTGVKSPSLLEDKPAPTTIKSQPAAHEDENAKLQQSTRSILSKVTFPTDSSISSSSSLSPAQGSVASATPVRNLFGAATAVSSGVSSIGITSSVTFSFSKQTATTTTSSVTTTGHITQPSAPHFGKTGASGLMFSDQQASSVPVSSTGSVTTVTASKASVFGKTPTSSVATSVVPSLFGQTTSAMATPETSAMATPRTSAMATPGTSAMATPGTSAMATPGTSAMATPGTSGPTFGQTSSVFGQPSAIASSSSVALFGQSSQKSDAFTFGGTSGLGAAGEGRGGAIFGLFGSSSTVTSSASNATPVFGGSQSSAPSFDQLANSTVSEGAFGGNSGSGTGGFFSGLGGKPDPEAAKTNPFGISSASAFGSSSTSSNNIFSTKTPKAFGSTPPSQTSSAFGGNTFGSTSGVGRAGFGGFGQQNRFGQASQAFGGSGGGPGLGFGSGATFSNPLGQSPFGSPPQPASSVFGAGSPVPSSTGFSSFASQNAPTFGALAGSETSFGQPSGFGAFGGGNNTGVGLSGFGSGNSSGFGSSGGNAFGGSSSGSGFSGGSSFTQYR